MSDSKYQVTTQTIETLLSAPSLVFEIPVFQRPYSWGKDEINRLIDDVFSTPEEDLPYFLGSIVLASQNQESKDSRIAILDGQQRLITVSLLIYAFIQKLKEEENLEDIVQYNSYIYSKRVKGKKKPKIQLQEGEDKKVYEAIVSGNSCFAEEQFKGTKIATTLESIFKSIENRMKSDNLTPEDMFERLLYDVELVCITASSEGDAFRLFETLNDRGLSLSSADLIKNKIFSKFGRDNLQEVVRCWGNIVEYTCDDDIVKFLRHHWVSSYADGRARNSEIYKTYKSYLESLTEENQSLQFVKDMEREAAVFEQIISPSPKKCIWGSEVAETLERLLFYRASQARPFILAVARCSPKYMLQCVRICESITVRSSIVGSTSPSSIEKIYLELSMVMRQQKPWESIVNSKVIEEVADDNKFKEQFSSNLTPSSMTRAWRTILSQLNTVMSTGETQIKKVQVEHIFPQKPSAEGLAESGISESEIESYSRRVGNLTLLGQEYNGKASNQAFSKKRPIYEKSDIFMTRQLPKFDKWGIKEIDERSNELAQYAVKAFPHPSDIITNYILSNKP